MNDYSKTSPPKLLDQLRTIIRTKHYSICTEEVYVDWVRRFILFHHKRHPKELGVVEVEAFLSYLAVECGVCINARARLWHGNAFAC